MKLKNGDLVTSITKWAKAYINEKETYGLSKNTINIYKRSIDYFIEFSLQYNDDYNMEDINKMYINLFITFLRDNKLSIASINGHIKNIKAFIKYITENNSDLYDYTKISDSVKLIKDEKVSYGLKENKYLTKEERIKLIAALDRSVTTKDKNNFTTVRNYILIKILLYCAPRASELLGIKISDIKIDECNNNLYCIEILTKGNKRHKCWIKKDIIENQIDDMTNDFKLNSNSYIASRKDGKQITRQELYKMVGSFLKSAGVKKRGVHLFRHSLGKRLVTEEKKDITIAQKMLNHSSAAITAKYYANIDDSDKRAIAEEIA